jgi:hypothetical protein
MISACFYCISRREEEGTGQILLSILNFDMEISNTTTATLSEDSIREFRTAFRSGNATGIRFVVYEIRGNRDTRRIGQTGTLSSEDLHGALHATSGNNSSNNNNNTGIVRLMCLDESRGSLILRGNIELHLGHSSSSSSNGMARSTRGSSARSNHVLHNTPFSSGESSMTMDYITQLRWVPRGSAT